ncbi:MAG: putative lipopolysaccharide heptosyltransferase III [Deltaproteobacteria bacterium]|nr:putative lipopolysaccharide heptosyltransferase III [Deltaproteobacteria bacterium]
MTFNRILIIQLKHLGDILLTTPVLPALKEAWPQAAISALTPRGMEPMLTEHPLLTEVLSMDRADRSPFHFLKFAAQLRQRRFDLVLEFSGGDRGAFYTRLTGAGTRVGFQDPRRPAWHRFCAFTLLAPQPPLRWHTVEKHLALVRSLGVEPKNHGPAFFWNRQTDQEVRDLMERLGLAPRKFILLHPPARWLFKCWTPEGYAQVIETLQGDYKVPVVITAAPQSQEIDFVDNIMRLVRTLPVNLAGRLSLKTLGALIAQARLFLGVDSAPMHLAAAVGTPAVVLFGPSGPFNWRPWGEGHIVLTKDFDCQPCGRDGCEGSKISRCLTAITPAEVLAAVDRQLQVCI